MPFFLRQVPQQLPHPRIRGPPRRHLVEALGLQLHHLGRLPHRLQTQRTHQPHGPPPHKPSHVLPPDQRYVLAEPRPVKLDQPMPMPVLLTPHLGKLFRLNRVGLLQPVGEVVVNARILLLL